VNSTKALRDVGRRSPSTAWKRAATATALLVGVIGSGLAAVQTSAAAPVSLSINRSDQQAVANAYNKVFLPTKAVSTAWTGSASACAPGAISPLAKDATFTAINYFRAMAGVNPVPENAAASQRAQAVATVMAANRGLSHNPSSDWGTGYACAGIYPARQSNEGEILHQGYSAAKAIESFVDDYGSGNSTVGHRMLLLGADVVSIGMGSTSDYAAGRVQISWDHVNTDVAWPGSGFFPAELLPTSNRWSYQSGSVSMNGASVSVTGPNGPVNTQVESRSGKLLVWRMPKLPAATATPAIYHVKIVAGGSTIEYDVKVFSAKATAAGAASSTPTPTPSASTPSATATTSTTPTPEPTVTATGGESPSATTTATPESTESAATGEAAAPAETATPSETATPTDSAAPSESASPSETPTPSESATPMPAESTTPTSAPSETAAPAESVTPTASASATPTTSAPTTTAPAAPQVNLRLTGVPNSGVVTSRSGNAPVQKLAAAATAKGTSDKVVYSITGQPSGVTINAATGAITGSPSRSGTFRVTVTAKAGNVAKSQMFTWRVLPALQRTASRAG